MVRLVLIAAIAGCYQPSFVDCADTCGSSKLCPNGLSCIQGYCRVSGATGDCATVDAAAAGCPAMAPDDQGGCTMASPLVPNTAECYVVCGGEQPGSVALAYRVGSWLPATIASAAAQGDAKLVLATRSEVWIGLHAPAGTGAAPASWTWIDGAPMSFAGWAAGQPIDNGTDNCGALTMAGWVSEPCTATHAYLIDSPLAT